MMLFILLLYFAATIYPVRPNEDSTCGYQACPDIHPDKLNVHIIPYSYEALGWKESTEQLFYKYAQYILSSVVDALMVNPNRKFIQVEVVYFYKWWQLQNDQVKNSVKQLINEGRLVITNGGWSVNDEATTYYQSIIDQFTLGHRWLLENFGKCGIPNAGWQIETNGHSREQASIYSQMGFDSVFIKHIDYRDREKRKNNKTLNLLWRGSDNLGSDSNIFTMTFASDNYLWANNFCYDVKCKSPKTIIDNESSSEFNLEKTIEDFTTEINKEAQYYNSTPNLLITMGGNMNYQGANRNFINLDKLISGFENNSKINIFYSTPACYAKAVNEHAIKANLTMDYKTDDFLPVVKDNLSWTGYYTSRPSSKRYERISNHMLQVAKQISALAGSPQNTTHTLASALGKMQYLEAIGGTEAPDIVKDYHRMLAAGIADSVKHISQALSNLLELNYNIDLQYCPLINISICNESMIENFKVVLYNPLGRTVTQYVEVPVDDGIWIVTDPQDMIISSQLSSPIRDIQYAADMLKVELNKKTLMFKAADIPPLGYKIYDVVRSGDFILVDADIADIKVYNNKIGYEKNYVVLNETGFIATMAINGFALNVTPTLMFYYSDPGCTSHVFKLNSSTAIPVPFADHVVNQITETDDVSIIRQEMNNNSGILMIKLYPDTDYIEIDWAIGPLEDGDNSQHKDFIIKYITDLDTVDVFYTDSNGRELLQRRRDTFDYTEEEPQAANYYPVTSRIVLKDKNNGVEYAVITDRAQGGSSLDSGEIELMVQRTCLKMKQEDVEPYDKGVITRGSHYITFGRSDTDKKRGRSPSYIQRDIFLKTQLPPVVFFTRKFMEMKTMSFLNEDLPENVHLLTLEKWNDTDNTYLIRLEHFLEKNDDPNLSTEVTVDLENLFTVFKIIKLEERTLSGVLALKDVTRFEWPHIMEVDSDTDSRKNKLLRDEKDFKIKLAPMQIRTFIATVDPTNK